jgi:hypothetical protein
MDKGGLYARVDGLSSGELYNLSGVLLPGRCWLPKMPLGGVGMKRVEFYYDLISPYSSWLMVR